MARIYATNGGAAANTTSDLYWIDPVTAVGTLVGSIGFKDVRALAWDYDTSILYGITNNNGVSNQLISINTSTGAGTLLFTMTGVGVSAFSTAIVVSGVMYAWVEANLPEDRLTTIDRTTGNWAYVGVSGISGSQNSIAYSPSTGLAFFKSGGIANPLSLSTGVVTAATSYNIIGASVSPQEGMTFSPSGVAYQIATVAGSSNAWLVKITTPFTTNTNILSSLDTGVTSNLRAITWVPDSYVAPTIKPIPVPTAPAPQAPCSPKSELTNGGKGNAGCNNGGAGRSVIYSGDFGSAPVYADPAEGEDLDGKDFKGIEVWVRLYRTSYPSGAISMIQRAMAELGDDPSYEGGRKPSGLSSIGDIDNALGNEQGGLERSTVDIQLADTDHSFREWLDVQDLEGDELNVLMASDAARGAF